MNLQDKRVLVTGASGGIGRELVSALLAQGAHVLLTGRSRDALLASVRHRPGHERTAVFAADLAASSHRARLCEFAAHWHGGIDVLINNAAVTDFSFLTGLSAKSLDATIATNLIAPIDLCRRLTVCLERRAEAHIVNIGSVFGSIGFAGHSVYCAAKFGLRGFSEALRRELADTNVRVHYFAPRATRTTLNSELVEQMNESLGIVSDEPADAARKIMRALRADRPEGVMGWPEKLFAHLNALAPRLMDMALGQKLSTIREFSARSALRARSGAEFINGAAKTRQML